MRSKDTISKFNVNFFLLDEQYFFTHCLKITSLYTFSISSSWQKVVHPRFRLITISLNMAVVCSNGLSSVSIREISPGISPGSISDLQRSVRIQVHILIRPLRTYRGYSCLVVRLTIRPVSTRIVPFYRPVPVVPFGLIKKNHMSCSVKIRE